MAEKLLSRASGQHLLAGQLAVCTPDAAMGTDGSVPMALDYFRAMQTDETLTSPTRADQLVFALDHYGPGSGERALALQSVAREYALREGITVFEVGEGIGHQLMLERGRVLPGQLAVAADSHATSYGALNAFGTGIGSSDLAGIFKCGQLWLRVPQSIKVVLSGRISRSSSAKDVALTLARRLGADGANYCALEYAGPGVATLDMNDRIVLANMSVEMGAKAGIFPFDEVTQQWLASRTSTPYRPIAADAAASYERTIEIDLSKVVPQVALPHRVDNVVDVAQAGNTRIDVVYLGTCTGGRLKDYEEALEVLGRSGRVAANVRLIVTPASQEVHEELERRGMNDAFRRLGAEMQPPGCGSCCGTCGIKPSDGERVLSTANRNFKGRMGNRNAEILLASPRTCAMAAVTGQLISALEDES